MKNFCENIRHNVFNVDINNKLDEYLNNTKEELYLDKYEAIVVDNNDLEKKGKIKVRVYGIHSDLIHDSDLPWALPNNMSTYTSYGSISIPENNSIVYVRFSNGDIYLPEYIINVPENDQLPPSRLSNYPNTITFLETKDGTIIKFNRSTEEINITHKSGAEVKINSIGNISIKPSPTGEINLGQTPILYMPDIPVCPLLGPTSINTKIPGNVIKIP